MHEAFLRLSMLLGTDAVERLAGRHVAVFGLGGVGSWAAEALARSGVGALTVIDSDCVSVSNRNRQLIALASTTGRPKAEVMAERIADINPDCRVQPIHALYDEAHHEAFFPAGGYDYIIDAIDLVSCKLSLIEQAAARSIPIISCMGTGNKLHPELFEIADISKTSVCPLARVMRKELRARGITRQMVLYSKEDAIEPLALEAPPPGRRSIPASAAWVPSVAGLMLAGYVVQELVKE